MFTITPRCMLGIQSVILTTGHAEARTKKSHVQSAVSLGTFANYKLLSTSHDIDSSIIKKTSNFCISHLNVGLPESTARHQRSPT